MHHTIPQSTAVDYKLGYLVSLTRWAIESFRLDEYNDLWFDLVKLVSSDGSRKEDQNDKSRYHKRLQTNVLMFTLFLT